jgi:sugar/nucleoside kinase (ribokinase family)
VIALIGSTHWDVTVRGAFPSSGAVAVGEVTHEGPAGGTLNTATYLVSRSPLLITQCPAEPHPLHAAALEGMQVIAADVEALSQATIVVSGTGERSIFLAKRPPAWPAAPEILADADVIDWHWTAPAALLDTYGPLMPGRVLCSVRSVESLLDHGIRPWAIVDSVTDVVRPEGDWLEAMGCEWCIITDGARGGTYWVDGQWHPYRAVPTNVVDATGCGDAFRAGVIAAIDDRLAVADAVQQGAEWGANAARCPGANRWVSALETAALP